MTNYKNSYNTQNIKNKAWFFATMSLVTALWIFSVFWINSVMKKLIQDKIEKEYVDYKVTEIWICPECLYTNPKLLLTSNKNFPYKFTAVNSWWDTIQWNAWTNGLYTIINIGK